MKSKTGSKNISQQPNSSKKSSSKKSNQSASCSKTSKNGNSEKSKKGGATVPTDDFSWEAAGSNGMLQSLSGNRRRNTEPTQNAVISNYVYQQMNVGTPQQYASNGAVNYQYMPQHQHYQKQPSFEEKLDRKGGTGSKILGSLPNIVAQMKRLSIGGKASDKSDFKLSNKQKRNSMSHSSSSEQFSPVA